MTGVQTCALPICFPVTIVSQDGYLLLQELGAVNDQYELTPIGRDLAKLPMDPRLGRMLLQAKKENALSELLHGL